ncbi:MAG: FkbM family methyltransferase [Pseudomonadota bacterium]
MKNLVRKILAVAGYEIRRADRLIDLDSKFGIELLGPLVTQMASLREAPLRLMQVGANDGQSQDPVRALLTDATLEIEAALIEPLPPQFKALDALYQGAKGVRCFNCAISASGANLPFYVVQGADRHEEFSLVASFDRVSVETSVQMMAASPEERAALSIETIDVPCRTVRQIAEDMRWDEIDVLVVDAEGYDQIIVATALNDGFLPRLIVCEIVFFTPAQFTAFTQDLRKRGYQIARSGQDLFAMRDRG